VLLLATASCQAEDGDVASLATASGGTAGLFRAQAEVADEMTRCLRAKGVPAVLELWDDGQGEVNFDGGAPWRLCQEQDGMCHGGGGTGMAQAEVDAEQAVLDQLEEIYKPEWDRLPDDKRGVSYLLVGEADYTAEYRECSKTIDYVPPAMLFDPAAELAYKGYVAEATNNWLRCARDHGYPQLGDADAPKADNYQTWPAAVLPLTITPGQLELLFVECPMGDFWAGEWPNIDLDADGYNTTRVPLRDAPMPDARTKELADPLLAVIAAALPSAPPPEALQAFEAN
jgi:hypothetical protein